MVDMVGERILRTKYGIGAKGKKDWIECDEGSF